MATQCVGQKIVYRGAHLRQSPSSSPNFQLLQLNCLARTPATEHACMHEIIKALIIVLGLLQVVGTVKNVHMS